MNEGWGQPPQKGVCSPGCLKHLEILGGVLKNIKNRVRVRCSSRKKTSHFYLDLEEWY